MRVVWIEGVDDSKHRGSLSVLIVMTVLFLLGEVQISGAQPSGVPPQSEPEAKVNLFELGGQVTDARLGGCFGLHGCYVPQFSLGPGASVNIVRYLSIDAVANLSTSVQSSGSYFSNGAVSGGRLTEALIGPRAEVRGKRYGLFIDARLGAISWSKAEKGIIVSSGPTGVAEEIPEYGRSTSLATQIGGGVEYLPTQRIHVRFDSGDVLVRYDDSNTIFCNSCTKWTNNFQSSVGIYAGVGKVKDWSAGSLAHPDSHTFWSEYTATALGLSLVGQAADAITTQRNLSHGAVEEDPVAGPFVKYGWSGQVGFAVLNNAAQITLMYGLHRLGRHRLERAVPIAVGALGGYFAYENLQGFQRNGSSE